MGLADRFSKCSSEGADAISLASEVCSVEPNLFALENRAVDKKLIFNTLKEELFEKIVSVPCWFEFDVQAQFDLIVKFLRAKDVKTPEIFARILQHSIFGFGVFDEYLSKKGVSSICYVQGQPVMYVENGKEFVDNKTLPLESVQLAVKNIINMSKAMTISDVYNFRFANFWVELSLIDSESITLLISKIDETFLDSEFKKMSLPLLLSDVI